MARQILSVALLLSMSSLAQAAKVKVWHHYAPTHYEKAQWKNTVVSNEGALRLSRQMQPLSGIRAAHIWDVVEDDKGNLYAATGNDGKIYKTTPEGKTTVVFESAESQVLCLALSPDGSIYAGTGPSGLIIRVSPEGNARVIYDSPESYVWSLAVDRLGQHIYAGTGPKGRIYQLTPEGKASIYYTTKQEHILCLAMGKAGTLFAGSDKDGLVYRIDPKGKAFVLFQSPQAEIRSLLVVGEDVYAGTSAPVRKRPAGSSAAGSDRPASFASNVLSSPNTVRTVAATTAEKTAVAGASTTPAADETKKTGASAVPPPATGENSIYFIRADGTVREVLRDKTLMLSLLRRQGRLFVGTGMDGQLFEIDEATRERSEIARLDHGQIHCLCQRRDGTIVIGAGDPGRLYALRDQHASQGTVVSDVLDAKIISKWGSMRWQSDTPSGTRVSLSVRSGNVAEPDETWSEWSDEQKDSQQATILAPAARYLQYRVTLATDDSAATPSLRGLTLRYQTTNQAPEIQRVDVPDLDAVNLDNPKKLKVRWQATDANEDELTYRVYVRKHGWKNWVLLDDDLEKKEYDWDTTTTPSGVYQVRVVASDRKDNADDAALTGERISGPLVVAHTPPTVALKVVGMEGDRAVVEATASDPLVRLTAASFAVNGKRWTNVFPIDELFDSKTESFRFKTESLKPGTYVLVFRVNDAAANTGTGDVVFTVK